MRQELQAQPGVIGVGRGLGEVGDLGADGHDLDAPHRVGPERPGGRGAQGLLGGHRVEPERAGLARADPEGGGGVPGVEDPAVGGEGGEAGGVGGRGGGRVGHGAQP